MKLTLTEAMPSLQKKKYSINSRRRLLGKIISDIIPNQSVFHASPHYTHDKILVFSQGLGDNSPQNSPMLKRRHVSGLLLSQVTGVEITCKKGGRSPLFSNTFNLLVTNQTSPPKHECMLSRDLPFLALEASSGQT